ncbi:hypothetical protein, partial [Nocardioides malaquae]|uniref:hypothetical protein n=1 Tax=Nocardioides malaquae TaxID=2773426 RepID=UPI001D0CE725
VRRDLRKKHFDNVKQALDEARFLIDVQDEEDGSTTKVLQLKEEKQAPSVQELVQECVKQLKPLVQVASPVTSTPIVTPSLVR